VSNEIEVLSLLGRYCHAMDGDDPAALLDCFAADGVFRYYAAGAAEPELDLRGHQALAAWFAQHRERTPIGSQTHVTVNAAISIREAAADVRATYLSVRESADGGIEISATGTYHDRVAVDERDGRWRFVERVCRAFMPRAS
jgi:hypothetical protein